MRFLLTEYAVCVSLKLADTAIHETQNNIAQSPLFCNNGAENTSNQDTVKNRGPAVIPVGIASGFYSTVQLYPEGRVAQIN